MKYFFFLILILLSSCKDGYQEKYIVDENLNADSLVLHGKYYREDTTFKQFTKTYCGCKVSGDSIGISFLSSPGLGGEHFSIIFYKDKSFKTDFSTWSDISKDSYFKTEKQSLILNSNKYKIGEEISGRITYTGTNSEYGKQVYVDVNGYFKCSLKDSPYAYNKYQLDRRKQDAFAPLKGNANEVTVLNLSYLELDEIPSEILVCRNLRELNLSGNKLKIIDLEILKNFKNLEILNLKDNEITSVPDSIFTLKNLSHLDLYGNNISKLPLGFFKLKKLTFLDLGWNKIKSFPEKFGNLNNLDTLYLYGPHNSAIVPESIAELENLQSLWLPDKTQLLSPKFFEIESLKELAISWEALENNKKLIPKLNYLESLVPTLIYADCEEHEKLHEDRVKYLKKTLPNVEISNSAQY